MTVAAPVTGTSLATHPFLRDMRGDHLAMLAEAATVITVPAHGRLCEEGGFARAFWLIRSGQVALDLQVPGRGRVIVETVGRGEVLGWSWMFPPQEYTFGAMAVQPVEAFELLAREVRARCDDCAALAHDLTWRFSRVLAGRLRATRIRLADQCAHPGTPA